jgi:hypothetical protein
VYRVTLRRVFGPYKGRLERELEVAREQVCGVKERFVL